MKNPEFPAIPGPVRRLRGFRRLAVALAFAALVPAAAAAAPDLVVESVSLTPDHGPNGGTVSVSAKIRNQGDATANASVTRIRVNQDPATVGSGDTILCPSLSTPALTAGSAATVGCAPSLSGLPVGDNYIWAIADVNHDSGETDTTNNRLGELFTVNNDSPDLVVSSLSVLPTSTPNGAPVTIKVTVTNQGTAPALASVTRVRINIDPANVTTGDLQICNITTPTIAVGGNAQVLCTPTITGRPIGTNTLWAIADVNKTAGQLPADTTNDRASTPLEVTPESSDLVIDSFAITPTSGPAGTVTTVTATVRNQGTAPALPSVARVRINQDPAAAAATDTQLCGIVDTPALAIGATAQISCKPTIPSRPSGENRVWLILDANNQAGQALADRANDRQSVPFSVDPPPAPDLVIRSFGVNPTSATNGKSITISAKVGNGGDADSAASKTRFLFNHDSAGVSPGDVVLCDQVNTVALAPNASATVTCKPTLAGLPTGPGFLWVVLDATTTSGEADTTNDTASTPFTVASSPAPDLVVDSVVAAPASAAVGAAVGVTVNVRNQGSLPATASTARVRFGTTATGPLDTDPIVCSLATAALAAGASAALHCNATVPLLAPGAALLWATVDATNTAGQLERGNDNGSTPFTVTPPSGPDLVVTRLTVRPTTARNGENVVVKARITNTGTAASAASVTTFRINQDANNTGAGDDVLCAGVATPALAAGAGARVRCSSAIANRPLGVNTVWVLADSGTTSGDVNPNNNRRHASLSVITSECADSQVAPLFAWPVEEPRVLQDYASFGSVPLAGGKLGYHSGVDLVSQLSIPADQVPVYAAADGEVVAVRKTCPSPADAVVNPPSGTCAAGWGNYVVIRHGTGVYSVYAQLGEVFVSKGCVAQGDRIAIAGSSGSTTIPVHVHFDVLANLVEPVGRAALGAEYYRKSHPFQGRQPETATGALQIHLDPRDFMPRSRVRLLQAAVASRGAASGGTPAFLAKGQEYISYGELVPGFHCIDLPFATRPQDGAPWADDQRYGWIATSKVEVLESGLAPSSVRIDGLGVFTDEGIGANFVAVRDAANEAGAEVTKAWGDQLFAPTGAPVAEAGSGKLWQGIDVPGTAASGAGAPGEAFVPVTSLGSPPTR